ncbi:hypothetical protein QVD17_11409 [Tagetes erecta]|uniref:Uncharacterized protein n=1 Tax=Tagetes erecta TaxID=13708 RepID=A0AAD8KV39_TARER|nr:hypothetical protein QVD17_11409 [Tagetes erecta]
MAQGVPVTLDWAFGPYKKECVELLTSVRAGDKPSRIHDRCQRKTYRGTKRFVDDTWNVNTRNLQTSPE